MRSKKGILMPETLKIIIAVLCIALLLYLLVSMYGLFTKKSKIEQGRSTLEEIFAKAASLRDGETGKVLILAPNDWWIMGFREGDARPQRCVSTTCICICEKDNADSCNEAGICKSSAETINLVKTKEIERAKAFNMKVSRAGSVITLEAE